MTIYVINTTDKTVLNEGFIRIEDIKVWAKQYWNDWVDVYIVINTNEKYGVVRGKLLSEEKVLAKIYPVNIDNITFKMED